MVDGSDPRLDSCPSPDPRPDSPDSPDPRLLALPFPVTGATAAPMIDDRPEDAAATTLLVLA